MTRRKRPVRKKTRGRWDRAHQHMLWLFGTAALLLVLLNVAVLLHRDPARADSSDNVEGWAWSSTGGWLSMNDTNVGAGGGDYGVNITATSYPRAMNGFAWSSNQGWVCFGSSCTGTTPEGGAPYAQQMSPGGGVSNMQGWVKILNLGDEGWISLHCLNLGECATSDYGLRVTLASGIWNGFGWHGLDGSVGWGWTDFSGVYMAGIENPTNPPFCSNGSDDDLDGKVDCEDPGCNAVEPWCPDDETHCGLLGETNCCANGVDDDFDGLLNCEDPDCDGEFVCIPEDEWPGPPDACGDGEDNDLDGLFDCDDPDCVDYPLCVIEDDCEDEVDNDSDGEIDCDDSDCAGAPECTPAWLQSRYGNVYSTLGIEGNAPPPGSGAFNATYCLTSGGTIIGFQSEEGCLESFEPDPLSLPSGGTGYVSSLGRLDVNGILSGQYGSVVSIQNQNGIQNPMNGRIFVYDADVHGCSSDFILSAKTWLNGLGAGNRGNGLLVIKGCNLRITGDQSYQASNISYLRNLASLGILVLSRYSGGTPVPGTGEIFIDPSVAQIVGAMYSEAAIHTGTTGSASTDIQLRAFGALVSRIIELQRLKATPTEAAEVVEFDGRSVVNPPPGYQDISKSLPALSDTFQ